MKGHGGMQRTKICYFFDMQGKKKNQKQESHNPPTLLQRLAAVPDKLFTGAFRQQYGALCSRRAPVGDGIEILVITSRDSGRWIIPKGWPIKGKKPYEVAAVEASEEAGVRGIVHKKPIGHYTYLKELDNGDFVPCVVDVFEIEAAEQRADFKERGQRVSAWVSPDEAARRLREIELKSLLVAFQPNKRARRKRG
jgi:8-oxo-dGTP pyrophosphatase MutT (NUDIX family)